MYKRFHVSAIVVLQELVSVFVRDEHVPSMDHMSKGTAGDGIISLNDIGDRVKLDRKGRPYEVGSDGRRFFRSSPRPRSKYTHEEWRALTIPDRIVPEKKEALDKDIEQKKREDMGKKKDDGAGSSGYQVMMNTWKNGRSGLPLRMVMDLVPPGIL